MARGRPPKPVEQRRLEGGSTVSHRPVPEPLLVSGRPDLERFRDPPAHLPKDAKEFWGETIQRLTEVGIIDLVDAISLEMLAIQYARSRQAGRVVAVEGHFAPGAAGQIKEHPALKIERDAMTMFLRFASEFALTPVARTRLGLAELSRRAMQHEIEKDLDGPQADADATAEEVDDDDVGLPGL
jgi:P27 family predicted phage terminase small subunit